MALHIHAVLLSEEGLGQVVIVNTNATFMLQKNCSGDE